MIIGNLDPVVVEVLVRGPGDIRCTLSRVVTSSDIIKAYILRNSDDDLDDAIISKSSQAGEIQVLDGETEVYIRLNDIDRGNLSPSRVYHLHVHLIDIDDETSVLLAQSFHLLPVEQFINATFTMPALSTRFENTVTLLGETGGSGYLDGVSTTNQPVGCVVKFVVDGVQSEYILEVYTDQSGAGFVTPLDSSTKIWRKI